MATAVGRTPAEMTGAPGFQGPVRKNPANLRVEGPKPKANTIGALISKLEQGFGAYELILTIRTPQTGV